VRRLEGKVAFITGGAGGIGSATARRFIDEGAQVTIADVNGDAARRVAETLGPQAYATKIDIGDEVSVKAALDDAYARFGRLDILFNNAALTDEVTMSLDSNVTEIPLDIWNRTLQINVTGFMLCCRHAIPRMAAAGGGCIVNSASGSGLLADISRVAYGASKAAVISLTQYVATQHGKDRIRCNAIAPGPIVTPHSRALVGPLFDIIARHMPMGELGTPEDAAALVSFLASDDSRYINGQTIIIDGGLMAHHAHVRDMSDFIDRSKDSTSLISRSSVRIVTTPRIAYAS
jgi:NAD(P)-dependent dehydrogenase (short-subunit alcohol dehydrogenase family)